MAVVDCPKCGASVEIFDNPAEREAQCPECLSLLDLPDERAVRKSSRSERRHRDDFDEEDDRGDDRDRKPRSVKKKGAGPWVWVIAGVAILGLAAWGGVMVWLFWPAATQPQPLDYLPDDTFVVYVMNKAEFEKSDAKKDLVAILQRLNPEIHGPREFKRRIVAVASQDNTPIQISLFEMDKDYTNLEFLNEYERTTNNTLLPTGKVVGEHELFPVRAQTFCRLTPRLFVVGKLVDLEKLLRRKEKPKLSEGMKKALARLDLSSTIAFATATEADPDARNTKKLVEGLQEIQGDLPAPKFVAGDMDFGNEIRLRVFLGFRNSEDSEKAAPALKTLVEKFKQEKSKLGEFFGQAPHDELAKGLKLERPDGDFLLTTKLTTKQFPEVVAKMRDRFAPKIKPPDLKPINPGGPR